MPEPKPAIRPAVVGTALAGAAALAATILYKPANPTPASVPAPTAVPTAVLGFPRAASALTSIPSVSTPLAPVRFERAGIVTPSFPAGFGNLVSGGRAVIIQYSYGFARYSLAPDGVPLFDFVFPGSKIPPYPRVGDGQAMIPRVASSADGLRVVAAEYAAVAGAHGVLVFGGSPLQWRGEFAARWNFASGELVIDQDAGRYVAYSLEGGSIVRCDITTLGANTATVLPSTRASGPTTASGAGIAVAGGRRLLVYNAGAKVFAVDAGTLLQLGSWSSGDLGLPAGVVMQGLVVAGDVLMVEGSVGGASLGVAFARLTSPSTVSLLRVWTPLDPFRIIEKASAISGGTAYVWEGSVDGRSALFVFPGFGDSGPPSVLSSPFRVTQTVIGDAGMYFADPAGSTWAPLVSPGPPVPSPTAAASPPTPTRTAVPPGPTATPKPPMTPTAVVQAGCVGGREVVCMAVAGKAVPVRVTIEGKPGEVLYRVGGAQGAASVTWGLAGDAVVVIRRDEDLSVKVLWIGSASSRAFVVEIDGTVRANHPAGRTFATVSVGV